MRSSNRAFLSLALAMMAAVGLIVFALGGLAVTVLGFTDFNGNSETVVAAVRAMPNGVQMLSDGGDLDPFPVSEDEIAVYILINKARRDAGVKPVIYDINIAQSARSYSQSMRDQGFFGHSPDVDRPGQAENVMEVKEVSQQRSSPATRHNDYMASPGHKANIVASGWTHVGIGEVARYDNASQLWKYWDTQRFTTQTAGCQDGLEAVFTVTTPQAFEAAWNDHAVKCELRKIKILTERFVGAPPVQVTQAQGPQQLEPPEPPGQPSGQIQQGKPQAVPTPHPLVPVTKDETVYQYNQQQRPAPQPQIVYVQAPTPQPQIIYVSPASDTYTPSTTGGPIDWGGNQWNNGSKTPLGWSAEGGTWVCRNAGGCYNPNTGRSAPNGSQRPSWTAYNRDNWAGDMGSMER